MSNHLHLLLQGPEPDALGRPLRWFMTQTAKTFHRLRGRRGHFWERRYRACLVEDDLYALAALRYLDRNSVRAGLVDDPTTYPWSSCAAYALGAPNRQVTFRPSYLALSPYPKVRQRHYHTLLLPNPDPRLDGSAGRGEHRTPDPPSSPPRETTKRFRTSAHSNTWGLKGVRYLFTTVDRTPRERDVSQVTHRALRFTADNALVTCSDSLHCPKPKQQRGWQHLDAPAESYFGRPY